MTRRSIVQQSFRLSPAGIGRRVAVGASFQLLNIGLRIVMTIGSTAVLARLLTPADFGYVAMAAVVTELAALMGAFGFANVLIQRRQITRLQLDTIFWCTLALGVVMAVVVMALSLLAPWLFADPQVSPLLRVLSLGFVIASLSAVPSVVLARQMRFQTEFWISFGTVALRTGAGIAFALMGLGVWSLVLGGLVGHGSNVVLAYLNVPYRPRLRFHLPLITRSWRTSGSYFGNSTLHYLNSNLDLLLIGRYLGATPLGLYQNARSLTDEIRARIAMPIQTVLFPAFSSLHDDQAQFQQLVMRAGRMLAAVVIPIGFGVSANARELVLVLYGEKWNAMAPILTMFGLGAALKASTAISIPLFNAHDKVNLSLRYNAIGTALLALCVTVTIPMGIEKVSVAVTVSAAYSLLVLRRALSLIGLSTRSMLELLIPPFIASLALWLMTDAARWLQLSDRPSVLLLAHVSIGAVTYVSCLHLLSRRYLQDFRQARALLVGRAGRPTL